ncbi:MAG: hypothetical protein QOJ03_1671 [Frankiaceae bacterium]|nr:hypothetical protein [Frankiaceae bacterium]
MTTQAYDDQEADSSRFVFCVIGADGRLAEISANAAELLGWDASRRELRLQDGVHPEDVHLLSAFLAADPADRPPPTLRLRVRGRGGEWIWVRCHLSPLAAPHPIRYAVAINLPSRGGERPEERASRLEGHLWRIALEVQAAEIGSQRGLREAWWSDPALAGLSERQAEILRRIVRGEAVPEIARDLVITESTVRNHLSAIYRKFGVHSQSALMLRLLPGHAR